MRASEIIKTLNTIIEEFGDLEVVGGCLFEDNDLDVICVIDTEGMEVWPENPNGLKEYDVEGIFLQGI